MINKISYKKPLLETPFHIRTSENCYSNDWYRWGGYKIAKEYTQTELEYTSMRNTAGVLDITPMYKYNVQGKDAKKFINKLITRDIENISSNQVIYGLWCNEDGFVVDDGTVFCFNNEINCDSDFYKHIQQELLKRIYLPIYLPIIALIAASLIIYNKVYINYISYRFKLFIIGVLTIVISEISIRYAALSLQSTLVFLIIPIIIYLIGYIFFTNKLKLKTNN